MIIDIKIFLKVQYQGNVKQKRKLYRISDQWIVLKICRGHRVGHRCRKNVMQKFNIQNVLRLFDSSTIGRTAHSYVKVDAALFCSFPFLPGKIEQNKSPSKAEIITISFSPNSYWKYLHAHQYMQINHLKVPIKIEVTSELASAMLYKSFCHTRWCESEC